MKYIDVSQWQGTINFDKLKGNVDGVIIRAGYGKNHIDPQFTRNASECNRAGIPCGAYWFSYAKTVEEAKAEAKHLLSAVKPYKMELPLAYDFEYDSVDNATAQGVRVTKELATSFASAFLSEIERGGYWALNYTNQDFLSRLYDMDKLGRYGLWLAAWKLSSNPDLSKPPRKCDIWQWSKTNIPGISGVVDTNESYVDFPTIIRQKGLNNLGYADDDGGMTWEYTGTPSAQFADGLTWAKSFKITEDPAIADALWRYHFCFHVPEDAQRGSGALSD